ncbi:Rhodanese-related sulfurtransferase [Algoriphagus ornithinivorans]|uniref:Rhodanese-related sulfurtransferase n=1 Tax=Algoriphagus ornithinivorans TaxID=226506 RepID=A0A1I5JVB8_9BACT|nr:rhodanese-like domain-containing protein [Algoriphagus ornithinivorans]SFO76717.1 Rhodanese-related sulfurtransferase [Algoriphagus ornithinivorans]
MKNLAFLGLIFLPILGTSTISYAQSPADSAKVVSVEKFQKLSSKKKNILIDVRTPEEMQEGHLEGALNINFLSEGFENEIKQLDKTETYLLYCRTGKRTAKAGVAMKAAGFKKVIMLDGGITAWKEQGKPIEE